MPVAVTTFIVEAGTHAKEAVVTTTTGMHARGGWAGRSRSSSPGGCSVRCTPKSCVYWRQQPWVLTERQQQRPLECDVLRR